jgi:hypothetical protein
MVVAVKFWTAVRRSPLAEISANGAEQSAWRHICLRKETMLSARQLFDPKKRRPP